MVAAEGGAEAGDLTAVPWVRVLRYEPQMGERWRPRVRAFDVVHEDYMQTYLDHVSALVEAFASRVIEITPILLAGRGFAPSLGNGTFPTDVRRHSRRTRFVHARLAVESAWKVLTRKQPPFGTYIRDPLVLDEDEREAR
jgi:hypothetical protein